MPLLRSTVCWINFIWDAFKFPPRWDRKLEAKIQNERNDQEAFLQQAQVEREMTAVQVNTIYLEEQKVLRTARAEASLIRSKGQSEAAKRIANAQTEGTPAASSLE